MCFTKRKRKQKGTYKDKQKEIVKKRATIIHSKEVQPKRTIKKITP